MKTIANWSFGNCIPMTNITQLDMVVDEILRIGVETPKVEASLNWEDVEVSNLNT